MGALNWDWTKMPPPANFRVGDKVVLVRTPSWTNTELLHLEGREAIIDALPGCYPAPFAPCYRVSVQGFQGYIGCLPEHMRKIDPPSDPFAEPRDMSDDTPNKVADWQNCPWKPPIEVKP